MTDSYEGVVRQRLVEDGCEISDEVLGSDQVLIGYKWQVKALSKMHVFTVVASRLDVDGLAVREFTAMALDLAKQRKGLWRGAQSGIIVFPVLVAKEAEADAVQLMRKPYRLKLAGFAALAQPVVADVGRGEVHTFRGRRFIGMAFNGLIQEKVSQYFPAPGRLSI